MPGRVPYTGLDGLPPAPGTIIPDDLNRTQASPAAFGAGIGQAEQQLGGAFGQAAGTATDFAISGMRQYDEAATNAAYDQLNRKYTSILHGDPNDPNSVGYLAQQGSNAMSNYQGTMSDLDQARASIAATLSPRQQMMFDQAARRLQSYTESSVGQHNSQQQQVWQNSTSQSLAQGAQQAAIANSGDDDAFKHQLADGVNAISTMASRNGWSGDVAQQRINDYTSQTWAGRVDRLALKDPTAAWQMYQANQRSFTGNDQAAVEQRLIPQVRAWGVRSGADAIINGGGAAGPLQNQITTAAQAQGVDPGLALTTAKIESGFNPNAAAGTSSAKGVFQLTDGTWAANGGSPADRGDVGQQVSLGVKNLASSQQAAQQALGGQAPQPWQVYLVHQQGSAGGAALLRADPNASAVSALAPAYGGDSGIATRASTGNGGTADMTVGQFLNTWQTRYGKAAVTAPTTAGLGGGSAGAGSGGAGGTAPGASSAGPQSPSATGSAPGTGAAPPPSDPESMLPQWLDQARHARDPLGVNDPLFQDQLASEIRSRAAQLQLGQKVTDQQNSKTLLSAALGIPDIGRIPTTQPTDTTGTDAARTPGPGGTAPGQPPSAVNGAPGFGNAPLTMSDLLANPQTRAAWSAAPIDTQMKIMNLVQRNAKAAAAPPPVTSDTWDAFGKLNGMAATDPEGFAKLDLSQYADQLPRQWLMKLYAKQYGAQTGQSQQAQVSLTHAQEVLRPALEAAGIQVTGVKPGSTQAGSLNMFVGKLSDALDGWTAANPGKKPTDSDILQMGNSLLQPGTVKGSAGWFSGPTPTHAYQTAPGQFTPTVPPADKQQIIDAWKARNGGAVPSDDQVAGVFMSRQSDLAQQRSTAGRMPPIAPPPVLHRPGQRAPVLATQSADAGDDGDDE